MNIDKLENALYILQCGIATVNLVESCIECSEMHIYSLHGASILLRDVETRLKDITETAIAENTKA